MQVGGRLYKTATHETLATDEGFVTDELLAFYAPMVEADLPLVISGNIFVSWEGKSGGAQTGLDKDDKIPGLRRFADLCHAHGSKLIAQLNHGGSQMIKAAPGIERPVSASAIRQPMLGSMPRAFRRDEIPGVVKSFADAAERARLAGCDGVQIQLSHGYLVSQFLTPATNARNDEYGGSFDNRMRLALEIYRAVRERVGDDYPVIAKINGTDTRPGGVSTTEQVAVAHVLQEEGLDAIEITRGHFGTLPSTVSGNFRGFFRQQIKYGAGANFPAWRKALYLASAPVSERVMSQLFPHSQGFNLNEADLFKSALRIPVITCGGFNSPAAMEAAVAGGRTDAVSVARGLIANPYLYRHLYQPDPAAPACNFCNKCIARAGGKVGIGCFNEEVLQLREQMLQRPLPALEGESGSAAPIEAAPGASVRKAGRA
ncbi:NADH oxidase [compost metagenome]